MTEKKIKYDEKKDLEELGIDQADFKAFEERLKEPGYRELLFDLLKEELKRGRDSETHL